MSAVTSIVWGPEASLDSVVSALRYSVSFATETVVAPAGPAVNTARLDAVSAPVATTTLATLKRTTATHPGPRQKVMFCTMPPKQKQPAESSNLSPSTAVQNLPGARGAIRGGDH